MNCKQKDLLYSSASSGLDIILLTETWLRSDVHSNHFFDGELFKIFRQDRTDPLKSRGGGALCAVRNEFFSHELVFPVSIKRINSIDTIGVKLMHKGLSLNMITIYILPELTRTGNDVFSSFISNLKEYIFSLSGQTLIVGDFKLPNFNNNEVVFNDGNVILLRNFSSFLGLRQFNSVINCNNRTLD